MEIWFMNLMFKPPVALVLVLIFVACSPKINLCAKFFDGRQFSVTGLTIRNARSIQFKHSTITIKSGAPFTAENAGVTGLSEARR